MTGICRGCGTRVKLYQPTGTHNVYRTVRHDKLSIHHGWWPCPGQFGPADEYAKEES